MMRKKGAKRYSRNFINTELINRVLGSKYKTDFCRSLFRENSECPHGDRCKYAHSWEELRVPPRVFNPKYKTKYCHQYHKTGICHYGAKCEFIHDVENNLLLTPDSLQVESPERCGKSLQLAPILSNVEVRCMNDVSPDFWQVDFNERFTEPFKLTCIVHKDPSYKEDIQFSPSFIMEEQICLQTVHNVEFDHSPWLLSNHKHVGPGDISVLTMEPFNQELIIEHQSVCCSDILANSSKNSISPSTYFHFNLPDSFYAPSSSQIIEENFSHKMDLNLSNPTHVQYNHSPLTSWPLENSTFLVEEQERFTTEINEEEAMFLAQVLEKQTRFLTEVIEEKIRFPTQISEEEVNFSTQVLGEQAQDSAHPIEYLTMPGEQAKDSAHPIEYLIMPGDQANDSAHTIACLAMLGEQTKDSAHTIEYLARSLQDLDLNGCKSILMQNLLALCSLQISNNILQ